MIKGLNEELKNNYGITFKDQDLLDEAFTQASYVNEHPGENLRFYERIEFLGDAVMQFVVSQYLFRTFPKLPQGKLTRLRAAMVNEESFASFARESHFDQYIRLGKGEEKAHARERDSLLGDIFESFIGALYMDQGLAPVEKYVAQVVFPKIEAGRFDEFFDHKTELQETVQKNGAVEIDYQLLDENGPENHRQFKVAVAVAGTILGEGYGHSKKSAEQNAARNALLLLKAEQK